MLPLNFEGIQVHKETIINFFSLMRSYLYPLDLVCLEQYLYRSCWYHNECKASNLYLNFSGFREAIKNKADRNYDSVLSGTIIISATSSHAHRSNKGVSCDDGFLNGKSCWGVKIGQDWSRLVKIGQKHVLSVFQLFHVNCTFYYVNCWINGHKNQKQNKTYKKPFWVI